VNIDSIKILYISRDEADANRMYEHLSKFEGAKFSIVWKENAESALEYISGKNEAEVIVTDGDLSGMSGVEFTLKLRNQKNDIPVVFLSSSKDVSLAVEVMRMGVNDYLLKEDVTSPVFPQSLLRAIEKKRLKKEFDELEIKKRRLEAMQETVVKISNKISEPLSDMERIVKSLEGHDIPEKAKNYLGLIRTNVERMNAKLEQLKNLKEDKTVNYIRDIKMIDLS
jgi:DNA-binding NtrC family response regulator